MSGQQSIIIGNWKMHFSIRESVQLAKKLASQTIPKGVIVGVAPHILGLGLVAAELRRQKSSLRVAAQNAYFQDEGAYTGEVSMPMLQGCASYVLVGHSERRHIFHESHDDTKRKLAAAIRSGITAVLCVGETLDERQTGVSQQVIGDQLVSALYDLTAEEVGRVIIAYEPVWAISSGSDFRNHKIATTEDAQQAAQLIRHQITALYGSAAAEQTLILYGGSANAENASSFLRTTGINGLLVGGASLAVETFWPIVQLAGKISPKKIAVQRGKK